MINRGLLRMKVLQVLYAFDVNGGADICDAEKELRVSIEKSYDLYHAILLLMVELGRYAESRVEFQRTRYLVDERQSINTRFVDSPFYRYLCGNRELHSYVDNHYISWGEHRNVVKCLYDELVDTEFYKRYMEGETPSVEADKVLWRKILNNVIAKSELLEDALEGMSIYWVDDVELIYSFVEKTIKHYDAEDAALQPMYGHSDDVEFGRNLLTLTIANQEQYAAVMQPYLVRWELERMSKIDILLIEMALTELNFFESIPANVILNVYIDMTKMYSSFKSAKFVNGILDRIVKDMRAENKLRKDNEF